MSEELQQEKDLVILPEEARERGEMFLAVLNCNGRKVENVLCQLSKLDIHSRKATLHFYPTQEQVFGLWGSAFIGVKGRHRYGSIEDEFTIDQVWINKPSSQGTNCGVRFVTQCSGIPAEIRKTHLSPTPKTRSKSVIGEYFISSCLFAELVADDLIQHRNAKKYGFEWQRITYTLESGSTAEFKRDKQTTYRNGREEHFNYLMLRLKSLDVDAETLLAEAQALVLLAAFASRELAVINCYFYSRGKNTLLTHWYFNNPQAPKRRKFEEPLIPRDRNICKTFLGPAYAIRYRSNHRELLDAAIYALLAPRRSVENTIVRLFSGLQSALGFGLGAAKKGGKRMLIKQLYLEFTKKHALDLSDLWPLFDRTGGPCLYDVRNALVHGDVISQKDLPSLFIAAENLCAILERVLLLILQWDVQQSGSSKSVLSHELASQWNEARGQLHL